MQIHTFDLHFQNVPQTIAAYLVQGNQGAVLIETGPGSTLPALRDHLAAHSLKPTELQAVIVTHIHLDHAGAAGWFAQQGVPIYVHHLGAPHLIDPSRLLASAQRIYGSLMETLWGEIVPASSSMVVPLQDGDTIHAAGLTFRVMETTGHARHHHAILLEDVAFTGDAAGIHLPGAAWADVPAPPPEFDLEQWLITVDQLQAAQFRQIYLTHFGQVESVSQQLQQIRHTLRHIADFVQIRLAVQMPRDQLTREYVAWLREQAIVQGVSEELFHRYAVANPHQMSVDGISRYWQKRASQTAT